MQDKGNTKNQKICVALFPLWSLKEKAEIK